MRISQLEYFVSAARNLSFTKAAKEHYTVQSAVSQQITALEEELGFTLFERTAKGIRLTPAGERYYADTVTLLEQLEENRKNAERIARGLNGRLRVGIAGANQAGFLGELKRFHERNPALAIEFCDVSTAEQVQELLDGRYDILYTAVFNMHGREKEIAFAGVKESVLAVFMNAAHPLARQERVTLGELAGWPNIYADIPESGRARATERDLFEASGLQPVRKIYVRNQDVTSLLLDFNLGLAVGPEELLTSMPKNVICCPLEDGRFTIELGWAYLRASGNPALHRFLEELADLS